MLGAVRGEFPFGAALDDEFAAGVFLLFGFVDGEELDARGGFDFGGGARGHAAGDAVVVERKFVSGDAVAFGGGIFLDERRVAFEPGEIGLAHKDAA